jgi:TonB family protein
MKRAFRFGAVLLVLALAGAESPDAICSSEGPSLPRPLLPAGDRDLIGASEPYLVLEPVEAPILRKRVAPRYPSLPLAALWEGWVSFQLVIDRDGNVVEARILHSDPMFDEAALEAVRQWKYEPARLDGKPVSVYFTVLVPFRQVMRGEVTSIDERGILVTFDGAEALELPRRATLMRRSAGERQVVIGVVDIIDRRYENAVCSFRAEGAGGLAPRVGDEVIVHAGAPAPPPAVAADRPSEARLRELLRVLDVERRLREGMSAFAAGISRRCVGIPESEILAVLEGVSFDQLLARVTDILRWRLTASDVEAAIGFYDSPAGRRLRDADRALAHDVAFASWAWQEETEARIREQLRNRGFELADDDP